MDIYPWQQQAWQDLLDRKHKLPHAILVKGIEGLGKQHFAQCFAELLLCHNENIQACGTCSSCHLLAANNHPDLITIQPEENSKVIKIEQIRNLITQLNQTSQGGYKIAIINQAELLNIAASNSLLKTLEEPPNNVIIILVTSHPSALTITIRSRCQVVTIKTPDTIVAQQWLSEKTQDNQQLLLALAENAPLQALKIQKEGRLLQQQECFQHLVALQNTKINTIQVAEQFLTWDLKFLLLTLIYLISDIIKIKSAAENIVNQDKITELKQLAAKTKLNQLFNYYEQLLDLQKNITKNNLNQQLAIENLIIAWTQLFNVN